MGAPIGNKNALGNDGGRPLKFPDAIAFDKMIDNFFDDCEVNNKKPTIERLAVYMGCFDQTLMDYENRVEYSASVKKARARCLDWLISDGLNAKNPAMHIFLAKNNYGYKDKSEVDVNNTSNYADRLAQAEAKSQEIDITPMSIMIGNGDS